VKDSVLTGYLEIRGGSYRTVENNFYDLHPARDIRIKCSSPVARVGVMTDTKRTLAREIAVEREFGRTGRTWTANINKILVAPWHPMKASVRGGRYLDKCAPPSPQFPLSSPELEPDRNQSRSGHL